MSGHRKSVVVTFVVAMAVGVVAEARHKGAGKAGRRSGQRRVHRSKLRGSGAGGALPATRKHILGAAENRDHARLRLRYDSPGNDKIKPRRLTQHKTGKPSFYDSRGDDTIRGRRLDSSALASCGPSGRFDPRSPRSPEPTRLAVSARRSAA